MNPSSSYAFWFRYCEAISPFFDPTVLELQPREVFVEYMECDSDVHPSEVSCELSVIWPFSGYYLFVFVFNLFFFVPSSALTVIWIGLP